MAPSQVDGGSEGLHARQMAMVMGRRRLLTSPSAATVTLDRPVVGIGLWQGLEHEVSICI